MGRVLFWFVSFFVLFSDLFLRFEAAVWLWELSDFFFFFFKGGQFFFLSVFCRFCFFL